MSEYPVLDNRSIDQWKVTELKEELKRRKLTTRGLKHDLIRRLDEALRIERENAGKVDIDHEPIAGVTGVETVLVTEATKELVDDGDNVNEKVDDVAVHVDISGDAAAVSTKNAETEIRMSRNDSNRIEDELVAHATTVETNDEVSGILASETVGIVTKHDLQSNDSQENGHLNCPFETEDSVHHVDNEGSMTHVGYVESISHVVDRDLKRQVKDESLKLKREDLVLNSSTSDNQVSEVELKDVNPVSEVSHALGPQVRPDSISTDAVSINETIELKDNVYDEDGKLDLNVDNLEVVGPSSSPVVQVGGESHLMDVEKPCENKALTKDDNENVNSEVNKKIDGADVGYSEKLCSDRRSWDDSVDDDVLESKQIYSEYSPNGIGHTIEKSELPTVIEGSYVDVVGNSLTGNKKDFYHGKKNHPSLSSENRKVHDQSAHSIESVKRQRRWNSNDANLSEPKSSNLTTLATLNYGFQSTAVKRNLRSDAIAGEDALKLRVVPPSQKSPSTSLRIDNFLRPFTLKAVQELLGKTGTIVSFWMDHIKTHCYVAYSTVEEAVETRNAVYNLQWPPNGGRFLAAEFVDPCEVKRKVETPQTPTASTTATPFPTAPPILPPPSFLRQSRQQLAPPSLPPPPPLSNAPQAMDGLPLPVPDKPDASIVTLDDLFRKTKATPRIYYLPLSEKLVAEKLAARREDAKI